MKKTLGTMIREARKNKEKKITLKELADKIKTHDGSLAEGYLSRIESDITIPSLEVAEQIATELELDLLPFQVEIAKEALKKTFAKSASTINFDKLHTIIVPKKK